MEDLQDKSKIIDLVIYFLYIIMLLSIIEQISTIKKVLDAMSTTSKQFPLQIILSKFNFIWILSDQIWKYMLGSSLFNVLFRKYSWGGFTYAVLSWAAIGRLTKPNNYKLQPELISKWILLGFYSFVFLVTIFIGLQVENWIPYYAEPSWVINMRHKQQLSAGSYFICFFIIWCLCIFNHKKGHQGALRFISNPWIMTYVFLIFLLDNLASFSWFPVFTVFNFEINGYEEIFREGQSWTSFDKVIHFLSSSAVTVLMLIFIQNQKKTVIIVLLLVIFWEIFEIALNPREIVDTTLDMVINSSAILLTALIFTRIIPDQSEI